MEGSMDEDRSLEAVGRFLKSLDFPDIRIDNYMYVTSADLGSKDLQIYIDSGYRVEQSYHKRPLRVSLRYLTGGKLCFLPPPIKLTVNWQLYVADTIQRILYLARTRPLCPKCRKFMALGQNLETSWEHKFYWYCSGGQHKEYGRGIPKALQFVLEKEFQ